MSLRDKILKTSNLKNKAHAVPAWDTTVYLKTFSLQDAEDFARSGDSDSDTEFLAKGLILGLLDEKGAPIFSREDINEVVKLDNKVCLELFTAISAHNRVNEDEEKN